MDQTPAPPGGGHTVEAEAVAAQLARPSRPLERSHQRASQAMARVQHVNRLLGSGLPEPVAGEPAGEAGLGARSVGWPERAAAAQAQAARARERSSRARQELASHQAHVAAAQQQLNQVHGRLNTSIHLPDAGGSHGG